MATEVVQQCGPTSLVMTSVSDAASEIITFTVCEEEAVRVKFRLPNQAVSKSMKL